MTDTPISKAFQQLPSLMEQTGKIGPSQLRLLCLLIALSIAEGYETHSSNATKAEDYY